MSAKRFLIEECVQIRCLAAAVAAVKTEHMKKEKNLENM